MHTERLIQTGGLERPEAMPLVSIIIPAFNAGSTLAMTLESVRQQTFSDWEAIIVDDGSSDDTVQTGQALAGCDARIRVLRQPNQGVSVARNTGIAQARGVWLLFLDSDDIILPDHLSNLVTAVQSNPEAGASFTGWSYMTPDGRRMQSNQLPASGDLFSGFAHTALFAIHACLVRRDLVYQAGGFDASLRTCEDWDLWQRVARLGTKFVGCDGETAIYRMRPHSLSRNVEKMLTDGLWVVERGFSHDPRVANPAAIHANGLQDGNLREAQIYVIVWVAGEMLGLGLDAREVLNHIPPKTVESIDPSYLADSIFAAVVLTRCLVPAEWPHIWPEVEPHIITFLLALEDRVGTPRLATRTLRILENHILEAVASPTPITIGGTHAATIEVTAPIVDIHVPCNVERLQVAITLEGTALGDLELPVISHVVSRHLLADAISERFAWKILDQFFSRTIYPDLAIKQAGNVTHVSRAGSVLLETPSDEADDLRATLHERLGWTIFLQELWDRPNWTADRFYNPHAEDPGPHEAIELAGREWIAVEISHDLPDIATERPARVVLAVGGIALGALTLPAEGRKISAQQLRAAISHAGGLEMSRVCVREALLGQPLTGPSLRQRLSALAHSRHPVRQRNDCAGAPLIAGHVRIDDVAVPAGSTTIFVRRHSAPSLTAVSSLAMVPASVVDDLQSVARNLSQSVLEGPPGADGWYVPEIIPLACPSNSSRGSRVAQPERQEHARDATAEERRAHPALALKAMRRVARKLSLVSAAPRGAASPAAQTQWPGSQPAPSSAQGMHFPILMYHRVAATGAANTARYRVTPQAFEAQLAYLREAGYQSVTADELTHSLETRQPLPGRRVLLTFDDAYVDFAENAWPLLQRYGFGAILFVVSGCTGKTNEWDRRFGEELALLGWDALRELQDAGVTIGAHSVTHPPLTGLSPREVAYEAARSRRVIQQELETPVQTFAYPYGDRDETVEHIIGACGYTLGFTCRPYLMNVTNPPLSLPRIEVQGNDDLATFTRNLTV